MKNVNTLKKKKKSSDLFSDFDHSILIKMKNLQIWKQSYCHIANFKKGAQTVKCACNFPQMLPCAQTVRFYGNSIYVCKIMWLPGDANLQV